MSVTGPEIAYTQEPTPTPQVIFQSESDDFLSGFRLVDLLDFVAVLVVGVVAFGLVRIAQQASRLAREQLDDERRRCQDEIDRERRHSQRLTELHGSAEELLRRRVEIAERRTGIDSSGQVSLDRVNLPEDVSENLSDILAVLREMSVVREEYEALPSGPPSASAEDYLRLGNGYYAAGDYRQALQYYTMGLAIQPRNPILLMNRALSLYALGYQEDGIASLYEALELRPDDAQILVNLGIALRQVGRHSEEHRVFDRALSLKPDDPDILVNRGVALHHLERYQEARSDYERALSLEPGHPGAHYNRACLFSLHGDFEAALEELRRAFQGDIQYRNMAWTEADLASMRADSRFASLWPNVRIGSSEVAVNGTVTVDLTLFDPIAGVGAYTVDISYDRWFLAAITCSSHFGGVCNPNFTPNTVRFTGASADGLAGETRVGTITFQAGQTEGIVALRVLVQVLADATSGAPRDLKPGLKVEDGTITIGDFEQRP